MEEMISIIVPVYNVKEYLEKTIESICNQTYKNLEIILVDDGSTDGSAEMCDLYKEKDRRVTVIHKENGGLVSARKIGISRAKGKYSLFVDGDDWIDPEMTEQMYQICCKYGVGLVSSGVRREYYNNSTEYMDSFPEGKYEKNKNNDIESHIIFWKSELKYGIRPNLVSKMALTDLFKSVYRDIPETIENGEDSAVVYPLFFNENKFYVMHKCFYHYVQRWTSITHSVNRGYLNAMQNWYDFILSQVRDIRKEQIKKQIDALLVKLIIRGINYHMDLHEDVQIPSYVIPIELLRNTRVVLYGAGKVGQAYYTHLKTSNNYKLIAWVDQKWNEDPIVSKHVEYISKCDFDYVLIAVTYEDMADDIREELIQKYDVPNEKIIWYEPKGILDSFVSFED